MENRSGKWEQITLAEIREEYAKIDSYPVTPEDCWYICRTATDCTWEAIRESCRNFAEITAPLLSAMDANPFARVIRGSAMV